MLKTVQSIMMIPDARYARIAGTLAWLIQRNTRDIIIQRTFSKPISYTNQILPLNENVKIVYCTKTFPNPKDGDICEIRIAVAKNDGMKANTPVIIGTHKIEKEKQESLGRIITEFDLYYDEECNETIDVVEYEEVVEEVMGEIYALSIPLRMELLT